MVNSQNLKASVSFVGDGTTNKFYFGFDYINKQFIKVQVGEGEPLTYPNDYTVEDRYVVLNDTPATGVPIHVYRETTTERIVEWTDGAFIKASQMTLENLQLLHLMEEAHDYPILNSLTNYPDGFNFNALGHRITNVKDPKDSSDVVTKHYMESVQNGFVQQNTALANTATDAAGKAKDSSELAKKWAMSPVSPDGVADTNSPTGYTQSAKIWAALSKEYAGLSKFKLPIGYYNSVDEMRASETAIVGRPCVTLGYYEPNDGGGSVYLIRAKTDNDQDDGGSIIFLDNGDVAELIIEGDVNVKQFGAKGDGVHDDTAAFRSALTAAKGGCLVVQKGNYNITSNLFANGVISVKDFGTYSDIKPVFGHKIISAKLNAAEIVTTLPVIAGSIQGITYDSLRNQIIVGHTNNSTQYITKIDFDTLQTVSTNQFSTLGHINSLDYIANNDTVLTGNFKYLNGECTQIIGDTGFIDGAVCYDEEHKLYYLNHASRVLYMYDENKKLINSIDTAAESEIVDNMFNGMIAYNGNLLVSGLGGGRIYIFDIANYLQYKGTINIGSGEFEDLFVKDNYIYGITANGVLWRVAYDMPNLKRLLKEPEGVVSNNFDYNGYIEFESGLIMQWGLIQLYNLSPGYQNQKITYPIAFKHKALFTIAQLRRGSNVDAAVGMEPSTPTWGTLFFTIPEGVTALGCHYIAFGY